jgi:hypothetical protein
MQLTADQLEQYVKPVIESQTSPTLEPIDADHLIGSWKAMMESGGGVAYGSDAGFLLGLHCTDLMTGKRKAFEYLWMCRPDKRSGGEALKLLVEFEDGAKFDGCVAIVVGNSSGYKQKALGRLYRRLGYVQISESFQKQLT